MEQDDGGRVSPWGRGVLTPTPAAKGQAMAHARAIGTQPANCSFSREKDVQVIILFVDC